MSIKIKLIDPRFVLAIVAVMVAADEVQAELPEGAVAAPVVPPALRLKCRYLAPHALAEWLDSFKTRTTVDALSDVLVDFGGTVLDDSGQPVPISRPALAALLDQVKPTPKDDGTERTLFMAILDAYLLALSEGAAKN